MFDDFGGAAMGPWGRRFTYVTVYATILAEPIIFHLTSMEALQQIFYGAGVTPIFAALIVALAMIPLAQVWPVQALQSLDMLGCSLQPHTPSERRLNHHHILLSNANNPDSIGSHESFCKWFAAMGPLLTPHIWESWSSSCYVLSGGLSSAQTQPSSTITELAWP